MSEQEQLASELDRALSLSRLGSLAAARKPPSDAKPDKPKGKSAPSRAKERDRLLLASAKGGRHKMAAKASACESVRKAKGPEKTALFSPARSEVSSCSNSEYRRVAFPSRALHQHLPFSWLVAGHGLSKKSFHSRASSSDFCQSSLSCCEDVHVERQTIEADFSG